MPLDPLVDSAHMMNSESSGHEDAGYDMNEDDVSSVNSVRSAPRPSKSPAQAAQDPYGGIIGDAVGPPADRPQEHGPFPIANVDIAAAEQPFPIAGEGEDLVFSSPKSDLGDALSRIMSDKMEPSPEDRRQTIVVPPNMAV